MSLFDYRTLCDTLERLYRIYGMLPRVVARTALGRAVFALDLGAKQSRSLLLCGACGNEGALCELALRFVEALLTAAQENMLFCGVDARQALQESGVTVVPCLNPDGLELCCHGLSAAGPLRRFLQPLLQPDNPWCANANGVDLRRQYPAGFSAARDLSAARGFMSPGASNYSGTVPLNEAEPHALCGLCRRERFRHALLLRRGEDALLWQPGRDAAEKSALCAKLLSQEADLPLGADDDTDGTFSRWFTEETGRPVFTVQTGKGNVPLPEPALFSCLMLSVLL